jgi:hypothetical protein
MSNQDYTLYSGAAAGAETCFGENAERMGINEVNYSFEGHNVSRSRGLKVLTPKELMVGDVSLAYVGKLMNRDYRDTPLFRNVLRSIWHLVNNGQQIFVVGYVKGDGTVKGGTGWGAEFAKLCNKPLYVFEQSEDIWLEWIETKFCRCETPPRITEQNFTGTGTRTLADNGRQAIEELFKRSFA